MKSVRAFPGPSALAFRAVLTAIVAPLCLASGAEACPFCTALKPTLSQRRDEAAVAVLAECDDAGRARYRFRVLQTLQGKELLGGKDLLELAATSFSEPPAAALKQGGLALLLARRDAAQEGSELRWSEISLNETSYAYAARAPATRLAARERLPFFISYLEHADPLLAEDAYQEFGHARFDEVAEVAKRLPLASFRQWLLDERVPQQRKGFYGMALGLASDERERRENGEFLRKLILQPASDFRAGFDGLLAGYLLAGGEEALDLIDGIYLADPKAAAGDVGHAMNALRFYHEYGRQIPPERLARSLRHLLSRRQFAAAAIVDLARWQAWDATEEVVGLAESDEIDDSPTRRAVIGFLLLSPTEPARREMSRLRRLFPKETAEIEKQLNRAGEAK